MRVCGEGARVVTTQGEVSGRAWAAGTGGRGGEAEEDIQAVSLRRFHSGRQCRTNIAAVEASWGRFWGESRGTRSDIWGVWAGAHSGIMAPDWCKYFNNMGAPIVLLSRVALEMSG